MNFLRLIQMLVFRTIREERFSALLSIVGVALGVGLFIGVKVASDRAIASFESEIKGVNPAANFEIINPSGVDFDERVYKDVLAIEEQSFPSLKASGFVPDIRETIDINGIYTVKSIGFLKLDVKSLSDIEALYREPKGVLITKNFSEKFSLKKGDSIKASVYDKSYVLSIAGIIDTETLPPNTVIMDLGNFQELFSKIGSLTRIDCATDEKKADEIRRILPSSLTLERKEERVRNQESLVASFRYNLQFVSLIAILVGVFLLYNTIFISVVKRRTEIGILRGLGTGRGTVIMLFTLQGVLLGGIGSLLGIVLGQIAAYFSVIAVQKTISTMYSTISIAEYVITPVDALKAVLLGFCVSFAASVIPSLEASRIRPHETAREGSFEGRYRRYLPLFSLLGIVCVALGGFLAYFDYTYLPFGFPFLAYVGILLIIFGYTCISPFFLTVMVRLLKKASERLFGGLGKIAIGDIHGGIYRFSIAVMSVAISTALIIALLTLIYSFRISLQEWITRTIAADVYVKPSSCSSNYCYQPLSDEVVTLLRGFPEVAGVDNYRVLKVDVCGKKVIAGFGNTELGIRFAGPNYFGKNTEERMRELAGDRQVAVSEYLAMKCGLTRGSTVEITTPKGPVSFKVNDVFVSYSTTSGFLYLDRKWLKEYWGRDDATQASVYLKKGIEVNGFIQKLRKELPSLYSLEIMNNRQLREKILAIFDRSFAITYAIEVIAIVVSLIGVVNTLLALVLEKKRELSIIRYLGGTWRQIRSQLIISAGIIGLAGIGLGVLMGPMLSIIFIEVINKISFGWEITFRLPLLYLLAVTVFLFITILSAGIIPSKVARKIDPKRFISFE